MEVALQHLTGNPSGEEQTSIHDIALAWNQALYRLQHDHLFDVPIDLDSIKIALDASYLGWVTVHQHFPRAWPTYLPLVNDEPAILSTIKATLFKHSQPLRQLVHTRPSTKEFSWVVKTSCGRNDLGYEYDILLIPHVHAHPIGIHRDGSLSPDIGSYFLGPDPHYAPITILNWNVDGVVPDAFESLFLEIVRNYHPSVVIIYETKLGRHAATEVLSQLRVGYNDAICCPAKNNKGGIWILSKPDEVEADVIKKGNHKTHIGFKVKQSTQS
ncbi:Endonuclease/exonuclease/phosphatase [Corchorus capsularis]|uniref:Endonuclease/exonuclease/phosphatase n=1 Tax=Corchorus capsularis TaxID=210143 RepID=A0A1R3JT02_COCAP|nr:Endonuclease/exonuclease/phosphatase [Corchorus capsularis]